MLTSSFIYHVFIDVAFCHLTKSKSNEYKSEISQSRYLKFAHMKSCCLHEFFKTPATHHKSIMCFICTCATRKSSFI